MPIMSQTRPASPRNAAARSPGEATHFFHAAKLFVAVTIGIIGLAILYRQDPAEGGFYPPCIFHYLTGFHCPGCGTLRAMHQLLHGNFAAAWAMNPLAICLLPGLAAAIIFGEVAAWREVPANLSRRLGANWIWALFVVIVAYGILRNVPAWPWNLLAPH
jgi:hypothetical protein